MFGIPHGLANALMITYVIRYNATDAPFKQAAFSQYKYPNAKWRYARIASYLGLGGDDDTAKVNQLIAAIEQLKRHVGIPGSLQEVLGDRASEFHARLDELADQSFDDQCTGSNPRYPLINDLKQLLLEAYHGTLSQEFPAETAPNLSEIGQDLHPIATARG
jgi:acetaldehyde dehydrogenase/alcohol dehydrogenase